MKFQILVSEICAIYNTKTINREDFTKLNFQAYLKATKNAKMLIYRVMFFYHITFG